MYDNSATYFYSLSLHDALPISEYMDLTAFSGWGCRLRMLRLSARISVPTEIAPVRWCRIVWCRSLPEVSPAGSRLQNSGSLKQDKPRRNRTDPAAGHGLF